MQIRTRLSIICRILLVVGLICGITLPRAMASAFAIRVTLLGTGTPEPDSTHFGTATLVQVAGENLLFDCGRGTVIRLHQAGVSPKDVDALFLTHLHSDHTVGIPDLWLTGWLLGRDRALRVFGPAGTSQMAAALSQAWAFDVAIRQQGPEPLLPEGALFESQEIEPGPVYVHGPLKVTAFLVDHGLVKPAFGYRVDYMGHSVVISGDTRFSANLIDYSRGVDCIIHAAWSASAVNPTPPPLRGIASAEDAGRVFAAVRPRLAVVVHYKTTHGLVHAVRSQYHGSLVLGQDLMVVEIGWNTTWRAARNPAHQACNVAK